MSDDINKIRVCHISSVHGQEDVRIFHKECVSLAKAGYDVYEVTRGRTYDKNGVHIIGVSGERLSRIERILKTTREIYKKAVEIDADIYHAHDPELLPVCDRLKKQGKTVIFDSHENVVGTIKEKEYIPSALRMVCSYIYERYQKTICSKLDAIVTASPNVSDYFRSIGCQCVIDLCNFPILKNYKSPNYASRKIVFAGNFGAQWNHDKILDAIEGVEGVRYILCGAPQETTLRMLMIKDGWAKVDYRGKVPFEEVPSILAESAVGLAILSAGQNTDGTKGNMANTKIFEEMMAGLPVVCTNFERWAEFVKEFDCGFCVDPNNIDEIRDAIKKLIDSPRLCENKGKNGRRAVEERFNWGIEEVKLKELYAKLRIRLQ